MQADIEALLVQGCHAAPVVTALTVQNTVNVSDFRVLDREWVLAQANAVLSDSTVAAVKLGMLGSLEMVDTVVELLQAHPHLPMVCDPVLRAGGGGRLGKDEVGYAMRERLLPLATIATPNLPEARILAELPDGSADECASTLWTPCPCAGKAASRFVASPSACGTSRISASKPLQGSMPICALISSKA